MNSSRKRARQRGQALVEFALLLPFLVLMIFGLIEFGRGIDEKHSMATLSREAAMLAARGTSLDSVAQAVIDNGADIKLLTRGGSIASQLDIVVNKAVVRAQVKSAGYTGLSKIGRVGDTVTVLNGLGLLNGTSVYIVEVFYRHVPLVPLKQMFSVAVKDTLYERAVF